MKLYGSLTSPYARKVRIFLMEKGIDCEFIAEGPSDPAGNVPRLNPLGKVPLLIRDDGEVIFDSPMIIEFLDDLTGHPLIPVGKTRWQAQRWHALQRHLDCALLYSCGLPGRDRERESCNAAECRAAQR